MKRLKAARQRAVDEFEARVEEDFRHLQEKEALAKQKEEQIRLDASEKAGLWSPLRRTAKGVLVASLSAGLVYLGIRLLRSSKARS